MGKHRPPISILKPVKGIDDQLLDNLVSIARQDYPTFEVLVGIEDRDDPAIPLVGAFSRAFPKVEIRLIVGSAKLGHNPKVRLLERLAQLARYDHLLVSDSNVAVDPSYLRAMAAPFVDPRVGMVTSPIVGTGERSLGALLENLHINAFIIGGVCGADLVGHATVIGKSMLFRKSTLDRLGGWKPFRDVLAEDYLMGRSFFRAGHRVVLSGQPIRVVNVRWSIANFLSRHIRWAQMRRRINGTTYALEPLVNPVPWLCAVTWFSLQLGWETWALAAGSGIGVKIALDYAMAWRLTHRCPPMTSVGVIPVKDFLVLGMWVVGLCRHTVNWRGNRLWIGEGSVICEPPSKHRMGLDVPAIGGARVEPSP